MSPRRGKQRETSLEPGDGKTDGHPWHRHRRLRREGRTGRHGARRAARGAVPGADAAALRRDQRRGRRSPRWPRSSTASTGSGVTFPGVVVDGVTRTAANVDKSWLDAPAAQLFSERLGSPVSVLNDADAAGRRRGRLRRRPRPARPDHDADLRHRHRQRAVPRRHADPEHRVRPPRAGRQRRRAARLRPGPRGRRT